MRDSFLIFLWGILFSCLTRYWSFFLRRPWYFWWHTFWFIIREFDFFYRSFRELYCITFDVFLRKLLWDFVVSMYSSVQQCSVVNLSFEWIVQLRWKHNLFYNEFSVWTIHCINTRFKYREPSTWKPDFCIDLVHLTVTLTNML